MELHRLHLLTALTFAMNHIAVLMIVRRVSWYFPTATQLTIYYSQTTSMVLMLMRPTLSHQQKVVERHIKPTLCTTPIPDSAALQRLLQSRTETAYLLPTHPQQISSFASRSWISCVATCQEKTFRSLSVLKC